MAGASVVSGGSLRGELRFTWNVGGPENRGVDEIDGKKWKENTMECR